MVKMKDSMTDRQRFGIGYWAGKLGHPPYSNYGITQILGDTPLVLHKRDAHAVLQALKDLVQAKDAENSPWSFDFGWFPLGPYQRYATHWDSKRGWGFYASISPSKAGGYKWGVSESMTPVARGEAPTINAAKDAALTVIDEIIFNNTQQLQ